jgi:hypothetical protein
MKTILVVWILTVVTLVCVALTVAFWSECTSREVLGRLRNQTIEALPARFAAARGLRIVPRRVLTIRGPRNGA